MLLNPSNAQLVRGGGARAVSGARVLIVLAALAAFECARAQSYPVKPVNFIVSFPPGSAPDTIARAVGQHMQQTLGQPIVIDNRPGAQGAVGAVQAARARADGYTVFSGTNTTIAANPSLFQKLPYDPAKDFVPVTRLATGALILVVKPDFPAQHLREFLQLARSQPGKLSTAYASAAQRVAIGELKARAKVDVLEVPYKSGPQAAADVLGGQISFLFADFAVAFPQLRSGKLKGLGVSTRARTSLMPEMPALSEELPGFDVTGWNGIVAPSGTPREVIARLWEAAQKAVNDAEVSNRLRFLGFEPALMGPEAFGSFIVESTAQWAHQIKAAGIQPE